MIRQKFNRWLENEGSLDTNKKKRKGNLRPPSAENIISWVIEACQSVSSDLISKSFKYTGNNLFITLFYCYLAINHDLMGKDNETIHPRLQEEKEILEYLHSAFTMKKADPYDVLRLKRN